MQSISVHWGHRITGLCNKIKAVGGHIGDIAAMAMLKGEKWPAVKQEEKESGKLNQLICLSPRYINNPLPANVPSSPTPSYHPLTTLSSSCVEFLATAAISSPRYFYFFNRPLSALPFASGWLLLDFATRTRRLAPHPMSNN